MDGIRDMDDMDNVMPIPPPDPTGIEVPLEASFGWEGTGSVYFTPSAALDRRREALRLKIEALRRSAVATNEEIEQLETELRLLS